MKKDANNRVALFVTCLVDQVMPEVGVSTVRLLRRAGYEVTFPQAQTCCGQPFFNSGFQDEARRLARHTVDLLADEPIVVLPSGSCTAMIRLEYPHLLADEPSYYYRALRLARKTYELSEFLSQIAVWPPAETEPPQKPITYHDSCHMCRLLGLRDEPRQVLNRAGYAIEEMEESDRCCGFGGLFSVRMADVSNAMTAEKLRLAVETAVFTLITADPGCLMQMRGMLPEGSDLKLEHLAVALERATR
jgi:L-lactate dehydrogenase complex protein LldE